MPDSPHVSGQEEVGRPGPTPWPSSNLHQVPGVSHFKLIKVPGVPHFKVPGAPHFKVPGVPHFKVKPALGYTLTMSIVITKVNRSGLAANKS